MKNLLLWALFIVTWQTWDAKWISPSKAQFGDFVCVAINHTEFFDDEMKARMRMTELDMQKANINVKMYEAKEAK